MRILGLCVCVCAAAGAAAAGDDTFAARFADPPPETRMLRIFHHPTSTAVVERVLAQAAERGEGGFVCNYAWTTNYLRDAGLWRNLDCLVERARARGWELWMYDERGWPAGSADDLVLAGHPEWQSAGILVTWTNAPAGVDAKPAPPKGRLRAEGSFARADGTRTHYAVSTDFIHEGTHSMVKGAPNKVPYINPLMREPVDRFIEITYEAYARRYGRDLGRTFTASFADEPSLMSLWLNGSMPGCVLPYSEGLEREYARRTGRRLFDDVPALVWNRPDGSERKIRCDFWRAVADLYIASYYTPLADWCRAHGMAFGGHPFFEEHLQTHVPLYGDFFACLQAMGAPGMDNLDSWPEKVPWQSALFVGSAAELSGAAKRMCEVSEHVQRTGSKNYTTRQDDPHFRPPTEETVRGALHRLVWGGVDTFTSYYGLTHFTAEQRRRVNAELGRCNAAMAGGFARAEIAVFYPSENLMAEHETASVPAMCWGGFKWTSPAIEAFEKAGRALFDDGRAFLYVDSAALARAACGAGELRHGRLRWTTLVLPGVSPELLPRAAAEKIAAFEKAGGRVVRVDAAAADALAKTLADVPRPADVVAGGAGAIRMAHRCVAGEERVFVMNDSADAWSGAVRVNLPGACEVCFPLTGARRAAAGREVALALGPYEAAVLRVTPAAGRGEM